MTSEIRRPQRAATALGIQSRALQSTALPEAERRLRYRAHLAEAQALAAGLEDPPASARPLLDGRFGELQFFSA